MVPPVVEALAGMADSWRKRFLRLSRIEEPDLDEERLRMWVEQPIGLLLLAEGPETEHFRRMREELDTNGILLPLVPADLVAQAWDLHLMQIVRLEGGEATIRTRPGPTRVGPRRAVLRRFSRWIANESGEVDRMLIMAPGSGRLVLMCAEWAAVREIALFGIDPDPRAAFFASRLIEREFGDRMTCSIGVGNPLVERDLYDDPIARLIPPDARARLVAADWDSLFPGDLKFDRVVIGDPSISVTLRKPVRRYLEGRYVTHRDGIDPALLMVEAGIRRLSPRGSVMALYRASSVRAGHARRFRQWLRPRVDASFVVPSPPGEEYLALRISADSSTEVIVSGTMNWQSTTRRSYPRSALRCDDWTVTDPISANLRRNFETSSAPLGDILLGGVTGSDYTRVDPSWVIDADTCRNVLHADIGLKRYLRPLILPADVSRFGTVATATRFIVDGMLPRTVRRRFRRLRIDLIGDSAPLRPPAGPGLLFAEGVETPAFLCDRTGSAVAGPGIGRISPADLFLFGLLHSNTVKMMLYERCPGGLTARCLARLRIRLPDLFDARDRDIHDRIVQLTRMRLAVRDDLSNEHTLRALDLEQTLDSIVLELFGRTDDSGGNDGPSEI
jgi:hypothetical protein